MHIDCTEIVLYIIKRGISHVNNDWNLNSWILIWIPTVICLSQITDKLIFCHSINEITITQLLRSLALLDKDFKSNPTIFADPHLLRLRLLKTLAAKWSTSTWVRHCLTSKQPKLLKIKSLILLTLLSAPVPRKEIVSSARSFLRVSLIEVWYTWMIKQLFPA